MNNFINIKRHIKFVGVLLILTKRKIDCPKCGGKGKLRVQRPAWEEVEYGPKYVTCPRCNGQRWIIVSDDIIDDRRNSF